MFYSTYESEMLGTLTYTSNEKGDKLIALCLPTQKYNPAPYGTNLELKNELPLFKETRHWLDLYFKGKKVIPTQLPLAPMGSDFQQLIWQHLLHIPYGELVTYGEIAKQVALDLHKPTMSAQAVGGAVGHNPISIIIPCHRVVGANRNLTGYNGGIESKIALLKLEGINTTEYHLPPVK